MLVSSLQGEGAAAASVVGAGQPARLEHRLTGNTLKVTNRFGSVYVQFLEGGRYREIAKSGVQGVGAWRIDGGRLCLKRLKPPGAAAEHCHPFADRKVGDTWTDQNLQNGRIESSLLSGQVGPEEDRLY